MVNFCLCDSWVASLFVESLVQKLPRIYLEACGMPCVQTMASWWDTTQFTVLASDDCSVMLYISYVFLVLNSWLSELIIDITAVLHNVPHADNWWCWKLFVTWRKLAFIQFWDNYMYFTDVFCHAIILA